MKTALFYLSAISCAALGVYGHSNFFVALQVLMWTLTVLHMASTLAVLSGSEAAIKARKAAKSEIPISVKMILYMMLTATIAMAGAPVLAGVMAVLLILDLAAKEKLK